MLECQHVAWVRAAWKGTPDAEKSSSLRETSNYHGAVTIVAFKHTYAQNGWEAVFSIL